MNDNEMVFLDVNQVLDKISVGKSQLYKLIKQGMFPSQINLCGGKSVRWLKSDIDAWMCQQVQAFKQTVAASVALT
jgi:predicted DNA-binding transcriptional regulator AlpA